MSFLTTLNIGCSAYTTFSYNGYSIKLPYYLGGKKTPDQIRTAITDWGGSSKTANEIQTYVSNNPSAYGIDCSGLVYYALNEASSGAVRTYFENKLNLSGQLTYAYGITASNLTNAAYGKKIRAAKDIKPGCIMQTDNGGHVIVIHSVNKNSSGVVTSIVYAHSNKTKGPHHGFITIGNQEKDLDDSSQTWNDIAYSDEKAKSLYNYTLLLEPVASLV
jgi:hypothetical protein